MRMKWMIGMGLLLVLNCSRHESNPVYNGRLEADKITLSAQVAGRIDSVAVDEGDAVQKGQLLCHIDDARYRAQKRQQDAQTEEIRLSRNGIDAQIRQVKSQLDLARETLAKTETLFQEGAATEQKRDELQTRVDGLDAQMDGLLTQKRVLASKEKQMAAVLDITALNLADAQVRSPIKGVVLNAFLQPGETAGLGSPLFDVADLSELEATIYVPLTDLGKIRIGQSARIAVDGVAHAFQGRVGWIASESEFTPKTILTQETRATLVYAVKVIVPNPDGILKIGMPVDVKL